MAQLPFSPNEQHILRVMAKGFNEGTLSDYYEIYDGGLGFGGIKIKNLHPSIPDYAPFRGLIYEEKILRRPEVEKFTRQCLFNCVSKDLYTFDSQRIINLVDSNFVSVDSLLNPDNFQIIISYSRTQKPFVEKVADYLSLAYKNTWYDKNIQSGDDWWNTIRERVKNCSLFIFVVTKAAMDSEYCQKELELAREANKPILPIRVTSIGEQGFEIQNMPSDFRSVQDLPINADPIDADGLSKLFAAIIKRAW